MTAASGAAPDARRLLDARLAAGPPPTDDERHAPARASEPALDTALAALGCDPVAPEPRRAARRTEAPVQAWPSGRRLAAAGAGG
jgi:hypothetical protein